MKKYYLFIALAMVAGMTVSCKNNKKAEADAEVVEAAKTILADDVLATIDELAQSFIDETGKFVPSDIIISSALTEEEKLIRPDYLLDPSEVNNLVTKSQKINALAILFADRVLMKAYEMPLEEANEAIARLCAEVGFPTPDNKTASEKVAAEYEKCKETGNLALFWQFQFAMQSEFSYLISQNLDLFFRNISEEQFQSFNKRIRISRDVVKTIAEYDPEVKLAWDTYSKFSVDFSDEDERNEAYKNVEATKQTLAIRRGSIAARRAEMLK